MSQEEQAVLRGLVRRLPTDLRTAVTLCYFEELTTTEAARRMGIPRTTLQSRLSQAMGILSMRLAGIDEQGKRLNDSAVVPALSAKGWWSRLSGVRWLPRALLVVTSSVVVLVVLGATRERTLLIPTHGGPPGGGVEGEVLSSTSFGPAQDVGRARVAPKVEGQLMERAASRETRTTGDASHGRVEQFTVSLDQAALPERSGSYRVSLLDAHANIRARSVNPGGVATFRNVPFGPAVISIQPRVGLLSEHSVLIEPATLEQVVPSAAAENLNVSIIQPANRQVPPFELKDLSIIATPEPTPVFDAGLSRTHLVKGRWSRPSEPWRELAPGRTAASRKVLRSAEAEHVHLVLGSHTIVASQHVPAGSAACEFYLDPPQRQDSLTSLMVQVVGPAPGWELGDLTVELLDGNKVVASALTDGVGLCQFEGLIPQRMLIRARSRRGSSARQAMEIIVGEEPCVETLELSSSRSRTVRIEGLRARDRQLQLEFTHRLPARESHLIETLQVAVDSEVTVELPPGAEYVRAVPTPRGRASAWNEAAALEGPITLVIEPVARYALRSAHLLEAVSLRMTSVDENGVAQGPTQHRSVNSTRFIELIGVPGIYRVVLRSIQGSILETRLVRLE